jgi:hypothetical protein
MYAYPGYLDREILLAQDSRMLTMEFAKYKAWRDFAAERLVYSQQILLETRNEMRAIETNIKKAAKKKTDKEVQEEARTNPRYESLRLQEQENAQLELMYEAKVKEFSSSVAILSRTVALRGQDIEQGNRGRNIGAGGGYDPSSMPRGGF